ncbi:MAG TPA: AbrB family transcriptional regulator [Azospirillaceae bacterium]|nr:AbrB family transcriptional regulator [Azospirillaceae bacterium]
MTTAEARPFAAALLLGGLGGYLFFRLHLPLAFLIGAMVATTAASMAGLRTAVPARLRDLMVAILGVLLGSGFSPAMIERLDEWALSLAGLLVYVAAAGAAGMLYLRRVAGQDPVTAYFAAMPGGFSEMVLMGGALGGDERVISLSHSLRIMLVVMTVPFWFQLTAGTEGPARDWSLQGLGPGLAELPWTDAALLAACGLAAFPAKRLGIPAGILVGPMLASAALHLADVTAGKPPGLLVAAAQIVIGASIGGRFAGVAIGTVLRAARVALGLTALLLALTVALAWALHAVTGLPLPALILAYAPGGLAEMSLVALALHIDPAFVATHHIVRIMLVILLAPAAFRLLRRRWPGRPVR